MNTRMVARDLAEEAPHSLSKRIARFAMAINGCSAQDVSKSYWKQAKRELTGGSDLDPNEALLESAPESERWDLLPGSTGRVVPVTPIGDEDDEGRSVSERLVEEGVLEAEHDRMVQSAKKQKQEDK